MPAKSPEQTAYFRGQVVAVCEAVLEEEMGIIAGSRRLSRLKDELPEDFADDFRLFDTISSETSHLPVDRDRRNWNVEALARKDLEIAEFESKVKQQVSAACRQLIATFSML